MGESVPFEFGGLLRRTLLVVISSHRVSYVRRRFRLLCVFTLVVFQNCLHSNSVFSSRRGSRVVSSCGTLWCSSRGSSIIGDIYGLDIF